VLDSRKGAGARVSSEVDHSGTAPLSETAGRGVTPPFVLWALLWCLGAVVAVVKLSFDIVGPMDYFALGRDFSNLHTAGDLALHRETWCVFDADCFRVALWHHLGLLSLQNYSYPPHALFIALPFALLPYTAALAVWTLLGILFFAWSARPFLPKGFPALLAPFTAAGCMNIWNGHYGFLFGGLWLLCFRWIERRPASAGALAGLMTFKPHLGLLIAAKVLTRRRALAAAFATTLGLGVLAAIVFGSGSWLAFVMSTSSDQLNVLTADPHELYFAMMPSPYVAFGHLFGIPAQIAFALCAIMLLVRSRSLDVFAAATATFLIVPYVFNYDMTVVCLGFAILLHARWGELNWIERIGLAVGFFTPEMTFFAKPVIPFALLYCLWIELKFAASVDWDRVRTGDTLPSHA
jgi:alpha-1,2-mannosyltransferase